ncbi:MAG: hypothetical protein O4751_13250, partial [Trichodesmium sp. St2_bin6]|nr:hypothetical protein [Trichodesmium sp. St2_bin6]
PLLRLFSGEAPEDSPLRDYIFQEFMAGRKGLAVRMPEELREELRRKYSQQVGWGFWFEWAFANSVVWVVGWFVRGWLSELVYSRKYSQQVGWGFWFQWVWANSVGWFVGLFLFVGLFFVFGVLGGVVENAIGSFGLLAVFGTVFGAVVGSFQWWVIRKRLSQARWWILATALASAILFSTAEVLSNAVSDVVSNTVIQGVVISSLIGLVIGSAQWLVLRKQLSQSHWWILASVLGITATLFAIFYYSLFAIFYYSLFAIVYSSRFELGLLKTFISFLSIFGIIYGVITGFALVWLLRQPGNSVINNKK